MFKILFTSVLVSSLFLQCNNQTDDLSDCPDKQTYLLKDLTGLDGCSWVLTKGDENFEPINLADFISDPSEDQVVKAEIVTRDDFAGICMVGSIVEIICVE